MKNYLKPISMTFMATVLCVSTAQAQFLDIFNPKKVKEKIGNTLNPGRQQTRPTQNNQYNPPANQPALKQYGAAIPAPAVLNQAVARLISQNPNRIGNTAIDIKNVRALYALRGNKAIWTNEEGLSNMGKALQDLLTNLSTLHGLEPQYYLTNDVKERFVGGDWNSVAELDLLLTQGYMLFVKDMSTGRINPRDPSQGLQDIELKKNEAPSLAYLNSITKNANPDELFAGVANTAPQVQGYTLLVESLAKINDGIKMGGWYGLDKNIVLRPGQSHPNVVGLRQRLVDFGYLPYDQRANMSQSYDSSMVEAMSRFQQYNFLKADGVVGPAAYGAIDQPVQKRISQIRANLEKWRLYPRKTPDRFILIDMGRQQLDVMDGGQLMMRMNVVVGAELTGTPSMLDKVTSIVLAPYWTSPNSIVVKETIPQFGSSPADNLAASNVEIVSGKRILTDSEINSINWGQYTMQKPPPYLFRQKRGERNALGMVKFNLTNDHSIYLHDTNAKNKFNEIVRYFSHGCIRLEKPFLLAAYLKDPESVSGIYGRTLHERLANVEASLEYSAGSLLADAQMKAQFEQGLEAKADPVSPVSVYIFGTTTVNYLDGEIGFGQDIYKQDERIIKALDQMANSDSALKALGNQ
ncbi:hypothetical protein AZI86_02355 [Bdellovibrio bacteriovorus]|uniref:L,D-TPase catalytic domain-containing protein n=1 Tax=Bdellovibrio bacteriovorus TaxID=959 RepID=A0A150WN66_BDEBC|nr:L,D-transpeptidase family protein [Bdellovibrio bacteriovorus]KYG65933.1 hypothetical protein AZI86_02355 [Bdellovibrio bacteriovorus]